MAVELDVFVGNTTIMDEEVYQLWLDGYTGMDRGSNYTFTTVCSRRLDILMSWGAFSLV